MPIDLNLLGQKLGQYRSQLQLSLDEVSIGTGIPTDVLRKFEMGRTPPTGDQLLILADYFKCDYAELISREQQTPLQRTDTLFRRFGTAFSKSDRWSVREFLFLCESEEFLETQLDQKKPLSFNFTKSGSFFKGHGEAAASALRKHLNYAEHAAPRDIYGDLRKIGIHVFRRRLEKLQHIWLVCQPPLRWRLCIGEL